MASSEGSSNENTAANKKRAALIKNAYLGLEKVENCHKVKSEKMKDQCMLRTLVRQYDRDRHIMSLNTYRSQQALKQKLNNMVTQSELDIARASGDKDKLRTMLSEIKSKRSQVNLAGPSAVEENLFKQILESRRENLSTMRKPENYDLRLAKKGFWEEDEDFYKSFNGAKANPFKLIDDMMEQYGNQESEGARPSVGGSKSRRMKSLSAVEKMSFTKQKSFERPVLSRCRRKSALAKSDPFEQLLLSHRETTTDKSRELEERREKLYSDLDPLVHTDRRNSDMIKVLERYEHSSPTNNASTDSIQLPVLTEKIIDPSISIKTQKEWRNLFMTSIVPSLTWRAIK